MNQQIIRHKLIKYILWYQYLKNKLHTYNIDGKIVELIPDKYKLDYDTIDKNLDRIIMYFEPRDDITIHNCIHCNIWCGCYNTYDLLCTECPYADGGDECGEYSDDIYTIIYEYLGDLEIINPQSYQCIRDKTYKLSKWLYDKIELYKKQNYKIKGV